MPRERKEDIHLSYNVFKEARIDIHTYIIVCMYINTNIMYWVNSIQTFVVMYNTHVRIHTQTYSLNTSPEEEEEEEEGHHSGLLVLLMG